MEEKDLIELIRHLTTSLKEAHLHITEGLQPEFENLARGISISIPNSYTEEQAYWRLATWWHGADIPELLEKAEALYNPTSQLAESRTQVEAILKQKLSSSGIRLWWNRPHHQLNGKTPSKILEESPELIVTIATDYVRYLEE